jgi:hypothetical protein
MPMQPLLLTVAADVDRPWLWLGPWAVLGAELVTLGWGRAGEAGLAASPVSAVQEQDCN